MGNGEQVRAVQAAYTSFERGDLPALIAGFADNAVWDATDALWATGTFFGHAGIRDYFAKLDAMWDGLTIEEYEIEQVRDGVLLARGRLRGRERESGALADAPFLHWIDVGDDGKITRLRILVDPDRPR